MKVAIDSGPLSSGDSIRGIGFHTKELVKELTKLQDENFKLEVVNFSRTNLSKYDIVHYQYFRPHALTLPFRRPAKKVIVTIHDLIRLIYPKEYPAGIKGSIYFALQKFNLRNVDAIITISETSKKDIVRFLGIDPSKIHVIYLAPQTSLKNSMEFLLKQDLPKQFVLYVGDVNYNKNLINLAKACKLAKLKLVMAGKQVAIENVDNNIENKSWREFLRLYKNDKDVIRLGYVDDLSEIYKRATVYCQPSLYEGFGLQLLESFEYGTPVVASRTQALVEVGGDACLYIDPNDPKDVAQKLIEAIENKKLRKNLIMKGKERLKDFSWKKTAQETLDVYAKI